MPRAAKPVIHQGWYQTRAGGNGWVKLCRQWHGPEVAAAVLAHYLSTGELSQPPEPPILLSVVLDKFLAHADTYYRTPSGKVSSEPRCYRFSFTHLRDLFNTLPAKEFRRNHLQHTRDKMVAAGQSRKVVNQSVGRIKRAIRWAVENGHLPDECYTSLIVLKNLAPHRSPAKESQPVGVVSWQVVSATLPHLGDPWRSLALLQWYTGMRPGEACGIKLTNLVEISTDSGIVDYLDQHKMAYKGRRRVVALGPQAISILIPWLYRASLHKRDGVFWCRNRDVPVRPSSYAHAVERAAEKAGVSHWHPNQLRHSYLTRVRKKFGLDAAQVAAGHAKADVTQVYAEADLAAAERVARTLG